MTLREARCAYSVCVAELVQYAVSLGYDVALDEGTVHLTVKNPTGNHRKNSCHYSGLAQDLLVYRNGVYLTSTEEYTFLGSFWKELGVKKGLKLSWGGDFQDGNHFSMEWQGMR